MGYSAVYVGPRLQASLKEHLANKDRIKKRLIKFEESSDNTKRTK